MKKKIFLFTAAFVIFYAIALFGRQLPDLVHGRFAFTQEHTFKEWIQFGGEVILYYLLALLIYLFFCIYHPQKKYFYLIGLIISSYVVVFLMGLFWIRLTEEVPVRISHYFRLSFFMFAAQIAFSALFYLIRYVQFKEVQQIALQLQSQKTELSFLRSQINPHFLFNNLNTIYSMVYEQNNQSLTAISALSELIRYMLYEGNDKVTLNKELEYLDKFITLQQLRFEYPSLISIERKYKFDQSSIPPFLLIPFIENAFKHGQADQKEEWLKIVITNTKEQLNFYCANKVHIKRKDTSGGIGLENVKQRLLLLYPGNHKFERQLKDDWFIVNLQLQHGK